MVRPEVLRRRLDKIEEYLSILDRLAGYPLDAFLEAPERYGSAERFMQLVIEALLDMGSHVIAELDLGRVESYGDVPRILREQGYLSRDLEERWVKMVGFRNILVHEYLDIDRKIVHEVVRSCRDDLRAMRDVFIKFL